MTEIKDFRALIQQYAGNLRKLVSYRAESLLKPGENFGSEMLKVHIKLLDENYEDEIIHAVAKTCPPNEFICEMFNIKETFKKEMETYRTIAPALNEFAKERGVDELLGCFAESFGSRLSTNPAATEIDEDAVLLMENLYEKNYEVVDRYTGFNLDSAKLILENLAKLHAGSKAYKLAKPEEFQAKIMPYLKRDMNVKPSDEMNSIMIDSIKKALNPEFSKYMPKIIENIQLVKDHFANPAEAQEPFATLIHNDLWVNNIMVKFEKERPIQVKLVDFQLMEYASPACDLLFFLYSSVELRVLETSINDLIKFYHEKFLETLKSLQIDVSAFSFENFNAEMVAVSKIEFAHIMFMLRIIYAKKEKAKNLSEVKETDLASAQDDALHENYKKKLNYVVSNFANRGWL